MPNLDHMNAELWRQLRASMAEGLDSGHTVYEGSADMDLDTGLTVTMTLSVKITETDQ